MQKMTTLTVLVMLLLSSVAHTARADDGDAAAIRKTVENAYVRGIHIDRDIPAIRKGFHESFDMMIKKDDSIKKMSIGKWIASIEKRMKEDPAPPQHKTEWKIPLVDVSGDAAVAKVEIYRDGQHIYSDYMSLYRFKDGWKIVAKIYYDHRND